MMVQCFFFFFKGYDEWQWTHATVLEIYSSHLQKCWLWSAVFVDPLMESVIWEMSCITLQKLHFSYFVCVYPWNTSNISKALKTHLTVRFSHICFCVLVLLSLIHVHRCYWISEVSLIDRISAVCLWLKCHFSGLFSSHGERLNGFNSPLEYINPDAHY